MSNSWNNAIMRLNPRTSRYRMSGPIRRLQVAPWLKTIKTIEPTIEPPIRAPRLEMSGLDMRNIRDITRIERPSRTPRLKMSGTRIRPGNTPQSIDELVSIPRIMEAIKSKLPQIRVLLIEKNYSIRLLLKEPPISIYFSDKGIITLHGKIQQLDNAPNVPDMRQNLHTLVESGKKLKYRLRDLLPEHIRNQFDWKRSGPMVYAETDFFLLNLFLRTVRETDSQ